MSVCSDDTYYVLQYDSQAAQHALTNNEGVDEDGVEMAFDVRKLF